MTPATLPAFIQWLEAAPAGTTIGAAEVHAVLSSLAPTLPVAASPDATPSAGPTWRERIWTAPPETRLGVQETAEAIGRPKSWVYRHTSEKGCEESDRLPHRKLDGELLFVVGEIREWIRAHEEVIHRGRAERSLTLTSRATA